MFDGAGIETRVRGDGWDPMGLLESTPLYKATKATSQSPMKLEAKLKAKLQ